MAHVRKRHIREVYDKLLGFSTIVGVFGHRQVGKSTFLASSVGEYRTLDDVDILEYAHSDPKQFVQSLRKIPMGIDECQLEPKLFSTLKEWVRTRKAPGQFVLSGSVRFTSRKAIRESLAGRISLIEMLPFSVAEIIGSELPNSVVQLLQHRRFSADSIRCLATMSEQQRLRKRFDAYLCHGGLPGLCFVRSPQLRKIGLNDLHDLMLTRDLRLVSEIRVPISTIKRLLSHIAALGFDPYIASEVRRLFGLAPQTQKKILDGLEAMFLIRRIPVPLRKKEAILLEDQLEELVYAGDSLRATMQLETAVYRNVRVQFTYRLDKNVQFESYLTRDHARVPIVIRNNDNVLGIIVTMSKRPLLSETRSASSFLRNFAAAKILYLSNEFVEPQVLDERSLLASISSIL